MWASKFCKKPNDLYKLNLNIYLYINTYTEFPIFHHQREYIVYNQKQRYETEIGFLAFCINTLRKFGPYKNFLCSSNNVNQVKQKMKSIFALD